MNFYAFQDTMYSRNVLDWKEDHNVGKIPLSEKNATRQIAEYSFKKKILSAEELAEHRKHCRAEPGNCPFEKAVDEADDITPSTIKVTKQEVYNRLAAVLTQLFQMAKNLAKPAIADPVKVEEEASPKPTADSAVTEKTVRDESTEEEPNTDAKVVAEVIEGGIEKMIELAESKGCKIDMNNDSTKYIVHGPSRD